MANSSSCQCSAEGPPLFDYDDEGLTIRVVERYEDIGVWLSPKETQDLINYLKTKGQIDK